MFNSIQCKVFYPCFNSPDEELAEDQVKTEVTIILQSLKFLYHECYILELFIWQSENGQHQTKDKDSGGKTVISTNSKKEKMYSIKDHILLTLAHTSFTMFNRNEVS